MLDLQPTLCKAACAVSSHEQPRNAYEYFDVTAPHTPLWAHMISILGMSRMSCGCPLSLAPAGSTTFAHGRRWVVNSCGGYAWAYRGRAVCACKRAACARERQEVLGRAVHLPVAQSLTATSVRVCMARNPATFHFTCARHAMFSRWCWR